MSAKWEAAESVDAGTDDVRFLMTALSLLLETETLEDRARCLHTVLAAYQPVGMLEVSELVRWLHSTYQAPRSKLVIKTDRKYPSQTFREGVPSEIVEVAVSEARPPLTCLSSLTEGDLAEILLSKSVCAWGACYPRA